MNEELFDDDMRVADAILAHVLDGTHYQRQIDALRDLGWFASADRQVQDLLAQGVHVI